jgi:hypothetical protein
MMASRARGIEPFSKRFSVCKPARRLIFPIVVGTPISSPDRQAIQPAKLPTAHPARGLARSR